MFSVHFSTSSSFATSRVIFVKLEVKLNRHSGKDSSQKNGRMENFLSCSQLLKMGSVSFFV